MTAGLADDTPQDLLDKAGRFNKNAARAKALVQQQAAAVAHGDVGESEAGIQLGPEYALENATTAWAELQRLPTDQRFDGPHLKMDLPGCANTGGLTEAERVDGPCLSFGLFAHAVSICSQTRDCGGVTQVRDASGAGEYELRRGEKGGAMLPAESEAIVSWLRKGFS